MGWQDAPVVDAAPSTSGVPAWASAPEVGASPKTPNEGDIDKKVGLAQGAASVLSGAVAAPVAGLSGMAAAFAKALGISDAEAGDVVRKVQEHLTYQPPSETGQAVAGAISAPFEWLANKADKAGQAVSDATGSPALGAAANTAIQAVPMVVGAKGASASAGIADSMRGTGKTLMQSALKPTLEQLRKGKADTAITTMLDEGINATKGGAETLQGRVESLNDRISNLIDNSPATVDKQRVGYYVQGTLDKFQKQVNATSDVKAIQKAWDEFLNDPNIPDQIPVKQAQEYKQGTYRAIGDKAYGELSTADLEAQKALARGLKEEIARAVPEVRPLNAQESKYITTLSVLERRLLMDANKNPAGLGWLTTSPEKFALWMADRSPLFKSLVARMTYSAGEPLEAAARASSATGAIGAVDQSRDDRLQYIKSLAQ